MVYAYVTQAVTTRLSLLSLTNPAAVSYTHLLRMCASRLEMEDSGFSDFSDSEADHSGQCEPMQTVPSHVKIISLANGDESGESTDEDSYVELPRPCKDIKASCPSSL